MRFTPNTKQAETVKPPAQAPVAVPEVRCGGCAFFRSRLDPNNPFDGFCHAFPPKSIPTGFRWAKTASNELGCSFFKKRG
jgi:hypothetical protein